MRLSLLLGCLVPAAASSSPLTSPSAFGVAPEPWLPLNGGAFSGAPQPSSPDPLVAYEWAPGAFNSSLLQSFVVAPVAAGPTPGTPREWRFDSNQLLVKLQYAWRY